MHFLLSSPIDWHLQYSFKFAQKNDFNRFVHNRIKFDVWMVMVIFRWWVYCQSSPHEREFPHHILWTWSKFFQFAINFELSSADFTKLSPCLQVLSKNQNIINLIQSIFKYYYIFTSVMILVWRSLIITLKKLFFLEIYWLLIK
jgi:hypothetical protein